MLQHSPRLLVALACCAAASADETEPTTKEISKLAGTYGFQGLVISKVGEGISNLTAADVDGDGRGDLAVVHNGGSKIELLLLPKAGERPGDGRPRENDKPNQIADENYFRRQSVAVEEKVFSIAIADLDQDKVPEICWIGDSGKLTIARRTAAGYEPLQRLEVDKASTSRGGLAIGDLDGNGTKDVVVLGVDDTYVFIQTDGGRFGEPVRLPNATHGPDELSLLDVDGDSQQDLLYVVANSEWPLRFRLGRGGASFGPELRSRFAECRSVAAAELDGKPGAEAIAVRQKSGRLALLRYGKIAGGEVKEPLSAPRSTPFASIKDPEQREFVVADLDQDGKPELLVTEPSAAQIAVHRDLGNGAVAVELAASFVGVSKPRLGDLDGDGRPELVVAAPAEKAIGVSKLDAKSGPQFPKPLAVPGGEDLLALDVADLDGDAKAEILVVAATGRGTGRNGVLAALDATGAEKSKFSLGVLKKDPTDLRMIDLDRDGRKDAVLFVPQDAPRLLLATSDGSYKELNAEQAPGLGILKGLDKSALAWGDVDGDGKDELLVPKGNFVRALYLGADKKPVTVLQCNLDEPSAQAERVALMDLDGDSKRELLVYEKSKGRVEVWASDGEASTRKAKVELAGLTPAQLFGGDVDGDGRQDALLLASDRFAVCRSAADDSGFEPVADLEVPLKNAFADEIALGDVNGDRIADAVVSEASDHQLLFLTVRENALEYALRFRVFESRIFEQNRGGREPREVVVADCTGDNRNDVAIVVHDRVIVYPQE